MRAYAGTMRFNIPNTWVDRSRYEFQSPDEVFDIQVLRDVFDAEFDLGGVAQQKLDVYRSSVPKATSSPIAVTKLGKYDARSVDVTFPDGDGKPCSMRLIYSQPKPRVLISIIATTSKGRWKDLEKTVDDLVGSFALEDDRPTQPAN